MSAPDVKVTAPDHVRVSVTKLPTYLDAELDWWTTKLVLSLIAVNVTDGTVQVLAVVALVMCNVGLAGLLGVRLFKAWLRREVEELGGPHDG